MPKRNGSRPTLSWTRLATRVAATLAVSAEEKAIVRKRVPPAAPTGVQNEAGG
jgi:hypothetical protein